MPRGKGCGHQSAVAEVRVELAVVGLARIVRVADQAELAVGGGADDEDVAVAVEGHGSGLVEAATRSTGRPSSKFVVCWPSAPPGWPSRACRRGRTGSSRDRSGR